MLFLSTLSLRRATTRGQLPTPEPPNFYPRSPCGERRCQLIVRSFSKRISIHALLAESDREPRHPKGNSIKFLSTLSLRRATLSCNGETTAGTYFYPRSPCGERRIMQRNRTHILLISIHALLAESDSITNHPYCGDYEFLSTLSLRRATALDSSMKPQPEISIHALLAESDQISK